MHAVLKGIVLLLATTLLSSGLNTTMAQRKKVGVVLSGGGAKGVAHIGALKVLEEAGIPVDYIAGTSMGAIVGGMYAIGYTPHMLDSMVRTQNWTYLLSDRVPRSNMAFLERESREKYLLSVPLTRERKLKMPSGLVAGHNIYNLFSELTIDYHDSISFDKLPIPFACVAYDMVTGKPVVLDRGSLPQAIRASMSIPGAFQPIRTNGMVLVDGGIANNFPADVAKKMGADIIIGIDVGAGLRTEDELNNLADLFDQITNFTGLETLEQNKKLADFYVHPDIEPYNAASFSAEAIDTLLLRGETAMRERWDDLIALKKQIGITEDDPIPVRDSTNISRPLIIRNITFNGLRNVNEKQVRRTLRLHENTIVTLNDLNNAVTTLQGMGVFSEVRFQLDGHSPYDLTFHVKESSRNSVSFGFRFDTEEMAAILLNGTLSIRPMGSSLVELTTRLSENPYVNIAYILGNETERRMSLAYMFRYNNLDLYRYGKKYSNFDYSYHLFDLNFSNIKIRNFKFDVGIKYEYFDFHSLLTASDNGTRVRSEGLASYYASAHYESTDQKYNPTRGISFLLGYTLSTNNFVTYRNGTPFSAVDLNFLSALSVSRRVTFLPGLFGRILIGNDVAFPALNFLGGTVSGRYLPQQIPFVGIRNLEQFQNAIIGARLDFRVRLWQKNFVSLKGNYAKQSNSFFDLLEGGNIWGIGLGYSYNTVIGPIELLIDYSNFHRKAGFYFNLGYYF